MEAENGIQWPGSGMVESVCSKACPKGEIKETIEGSAPCCWKCRSCAADEIILDGNQKCKKCAKGMLPSSDLRVCLPIEVEHVRYTDSESLVSMALACFGLIVTGTLLLYNFTLSEQFL